MYLLDIKTIKFFCVSVLFTGMVAGQCRELKSVFQGKFAELCQKRGINLAKPTMRFLDLSNVIPSEVKYAVNSFKNDRQQKAMIFYGIAGMGKNYTAEAIAGELDGYFLTCNAPMVAKKFVGSGTDFVEAIFGWANQVVQETGKKVVLFFDEGDALTHGSENTETPGAHAIMKQIGIEVNKCNTNPQNKIFVIVATNRYEEFAPELKQRFDKCEFVAPNLEERQQLISNIIDTKMNNYGYCDARQKIVQYLAKQTNGFSIRNLHDFIQNSFKTALTLGYAAPEDEHFIWALYKKKQEVLKDAEKSKSDVQHTSKKSRWAVGDLVPTAQDTKYSIGFGVSALGVKYLSQFETISAAKNGAILDMVGSLKMAVGVAAAVLASPAMLVAAAAAPGMAVLHCIGSDVREWICPSELQVFTSVERKLAVQRAKDALVQSQKNSEAMIRELQMLKREAQRKADRLEIIRKYIAHKDTPLNAAGIPNILEADLGTYKAKWGEEAYENIVHLIQNAPTIIAQSLKNLQDSHA